MGAEAVAALFFVVGVSLFYYIGLGVLRSQDHSTDRLVSMQTRAQLMERSLAERAIAPIVQRVGSLVLRYTPHGWMRRTRERLALGGWQELFDVNAWAAIRIVSILLGVVGAFLVPGNFTGLQKLLVVFLMIGAGFALPDAILNRRIEERREAMRKELPEILDLLVISVEAGLGFDGAMSRVIESVKGEMSTEFSRMQAQTRVGVSRRDALEQLGERTDVDELRSFILAMNQADSFGVSIARVLRVQSEEMRTRRRQRAQERAFAAPVKMVFPLVLCVFPAMFVLLIGPAAIQLRNSLF
ncbi:MAG: type II secretion system F family protein [Acidimicrobiia bacterium]|nr:type II secretion system F family protein [Acidimicrobiia bacterium]